MPSLAEAGYRTVSLGVMQASPVNRNRFKAVVVAWLLVPVVLAATILFASFAETCKNEPLAEITSPKGEHKLVLFERTCSGTIAWTTHASVVRATETLPSEAGNVLISFERHGSLLESRAAPEVKAQWLETKVLQLSYSAAAPVQSTKSVSGPVIINHVRAE
jgi:hypothetical protein